MSSPYTSPTLVGYNANAPSDDGSNVASNALQWSKHIDKIGNPLRTYIDAINTNVQAAFTSIYGETTAEADIGLTLVSSQYSSAAPYDLRRILTPNNSGAKAANSAALKALLDPTVNGPRGWFVFPNTTGTDTYYFDAVIIQIRDGCRLDLQGCTLNFSGAYSASNDKQGFFTYQRKVEICNGTIVVDYDGSAGTNNGLVILEGARNGYPWAGADGIDENGFESFIGGNWLHDLHIETNNPGPLVAISLLGGLHNSKIERLTGDMGGVVEVFIYYEWGEYAFAVDETQTTTHAVNLKIDQVTGNNLKSDGVLGAVAEIVGANSFTLTNIHGDGCYHVVHVRCGEALYHNPGAPYVIGGKTRWQTIENITGQNVVSTGLSLEGSEAATGYLSGAGLTDDDICDLQGFIVNAVSLDAGIYCNGPLIMNGGTVRGASSDCLTIGQDCLWASINGAHLLNGGGVGVRANTTDSIRSSPRLKRVELKGCLIGGNVGSAVAIDHCESALIARNQLGYKTGEIQTSGVSASSNASGVVCDGNDTTTNSGTAYALAGSGDRGCDVRNARGERARSGSWKVDGIAFATASALIDEANIINTADKYTTKKVLDTNNKRLYLADGPGVNDTWTIVDGSASITPAP